MAYYTTPPLSNKPLIDPLLIRNGYGGSLSETVGQARTIYYTFDPAPLGYVSVGRTGATAMNASQQAMVKQVLAKLSAIADVKFVQGARYISPLHNKTDEYGYINPQNILPQYDLSFHSYTNGMGTGEAVPQMSKATDGVSYIGGRVTIQQAAFSQQGALYLVMHETGHAMGLKHPGNYSNGFPSPPYLPSQYDNASYTVMSYNGNSYKTTNYGALDKSALSYLYGAKGSDKRVVSGNVVVDTDFDDVFDGKTKTVGQVYNGKAGHDVGYGSNFHDKLRGGAGDDRLFGLAGNDTLYGEAGYDLLDGGAGNDLLVSDAANSSDILRGGDGNDTILGNLGADSIAGGNGNDSIRAHNGADSIWGGAGNDTIIADEANGNFNDTIYGGTGFDSIMGGGGDDLIYGSDASNPTLDIADRIDGGMGNDTIDGGYGNDALIGGMGNDSILGGYGNDGMNGGQGNDTLIGGEGNDTLVGGTGNDLMNGGAGDDVIYLSDTDSSVTGGTGNDTFLFNFAANPTEGYGAPTLITDFQGAGVAGGDLLSFKNFTNITDIGGSPLLDANAFITNGINNGGGSVTFNFMADGQQWNLTVVGGAGMNASDIIWG